VIDRNKTALTHNITRLAAVWMDGHGFKPVETEVTIGRNWVADIAGVIQPTQTELINLKLIKRPPRYPAYGSRDEVAVGAYKRAHELWMADYRLIPQPITAAIEVKTSRADFMRDLKWHRKWRTNLCLLAVPDGIVRDDEWPGGWGRLVYDRTGTRLLRYTPGRLDSVPAVQQLAVVLAVAVRRDHHTRHERLREFNRQLRVDEIDGKTIARLNKAVSFLLEIANGKSIEDAKMWAGIRVELPPYLMERLREFQTKLDGRKDNA
jgi:hypothetical protein